MPRHPRLFIPGATYHVYCRVARGEFVFDDDPGDYVFSGHREIIGACVPRLIDLRSVLRGFADGEHCDCLECYLHWIRSVAEARWAAEGLSHLPWWAPAKHVDEIVARDQHPAPQMFNGQQLAEERAELQISAFVDRFESVSGYSLDELSSRYRSTRHITGRIEFCVLAVSRYGLRSCEIAALLDKGRNSVTRWLNQGLRREHNDPTFATRLDTLDSVISRR